MAVLTRQDLQELLTASIGPACHELRSPLAVVYGFAKMLETNTSIDEPGQKYVTQIVNGAQRIDDLLDALSKIGRIAAGRLVPTMESGSIKALVDDLCSTSTNNARVAIDAGPDLHVKADPAWLTEAFVGIINALCFEDELDVRVSWTHDAHEVTVNFIPNSSFPMIDVEPAKAAMGLTLARMRIVAMGGALDGQGDRITVVLPRG